MIRRQRSYGSKHVSRKSARASLSQLLWGCTTERLAGFTAESLAGSWNVSLATAAEMLEAARAQRLRP